MGQCYFREYRHADPTETRQSPSRSTPEYVYVRSSYNTFELNQFIDSNAVSMTPNASTSMGNHNASTPPLNSSSSTGPSTNLKPQLYVNGSQVAYPSFAGAFTYGQWAGTNPFGAAAQPPSYPYAYFGAANPMTQSYAFGQSQAEVRSTLPTVTKPDTSTHNSLPKNVDTSHSHSTLTAASSVLAEQSVTTPPSDGQSGSAGEDGLQAAQFAEILRANPQLASILLAAIGQAQPAS